MKNTTRVTTDNDTARFDQACQLFDAREYFEAHEVWEELWNEAQGARHAYLQGLIQVAAALHHAQNNNVNGCRKLFASALGYLKKGTSEAREVDIEKLTDLVLSFELILQDKLNGKTVELPFFPIPKR